VTEKLKITVGGANDFRDALATGWGLSDVDAACLIRQGHSPSMASAMVGIGVLKLLSPKKAKDLPRKFVLAARADRVIAFNADSHSRGESPHSVMHVTIEPGEIAGWSRTEVSMRADKAGMNQNATLILAGTEVPCTVPDGDAEEAFRELITALGGIVS
jgi:hypothetical protein